MSERLEELSKLIRQHFPNKECNMHRLTYEWKKHLDDKRYLEDITNTFETAIEHVTVDIKKLSYFKKQ